MAEAAHAGSAVNRPVKTSDSVHDAKDRAEPVATTSQRDLPRRPGWEGPTYYGRSQLKAAPFNKWIVGGYIFLAGLSGASALLSTLAETVGPKSAYGVGRRGRYLSMLAPSVGSLFLIWDLHTPQRFYNMFRIAKRSSPMSIGTWILTSFIPFSGLGFLGQLAADLLPARRWLRTAARLASAPAALPGTGLSIYTASLLSATSTPYWAAAPRALAVRFAASSVASGAAALSLGEEDPAMRDALNAVIGAALVSEFAASVVQKRAARAKGVGESLHSRWGRIERAAVEGLGVVAPIGLHAATHIVRDERKVAALSDLAALAVLFGSAMLRVTTLAIGDDSASRPEVSFRFSQPENLPKKGNLPKTG